MIGTTSTKSGTPIVGDSATTNVVRIFYLNKVTFLLNIIARMEADVPLALEPDATSAFSLPLLTLSLVTLLMQISKCPQ